MPGSLVSIQDAIKDAQHHHLTIIKLHSLLTNALVCKQHGHVGTVSGDKACKHCRQVRCQDIMPH